MVVDALDLLGQHCVLGLVRTLLAFSPGFEFGNGSRTFSARKRNLAMTTVLSVVIDNLRMKGDACIMRLKNFALLSLASALLGVTVMSVAQRTPVPSPGTQQTSSMGRHGMFGHRTGTGQIVGNKNTKVYHLPGDKGSMPADKNRVYFRTEQAAIAAGFHAAGSSKTPGANMHDNTSPGNHSMHNPFHLHRHTDSASPTKTGGPVPK